MYFTYEVKDSLMKIDFTFEIETFSHVKYRFRK